MVRFLPILTPAIAIAFLTGCATTGQVIPATPAPLPGAAPDASSSPGSSAEPDESALPEAARARFASEKIEVVPKPGDEDNYVFKDGLGEMSTNAFLERYRRLVGTAESPGHRAAGGVVPIVLGGLVLAAGLAGAIALYSQPPASAQNCMQTASGPVCVPASSSGIPPATTASLLLAGTGAIGGTLVVIGIAATRDRGYSLTRAEAERYSLQYNRTLLRKISSETPATP
jgi:hypothetical protein